MGLISITPTVKTVGSSSGLSFGTLREMGLLEMRYESVGGIPDCYDLVWTVVGPITFTDSQGNNWKQGDEIVWEK
jgi:hypothetical protein